MIQYLASLRGSGATGPNTSSPKQQVRPCLLHNVPRGIIACPPLFFDRIRDSGTQLCIKLYVSVLLSYTIRPMLGAVPALEPDFSLVALSGIEPNRSETRVLQTLWYTSTASTPCLVFLWRICEPNAARINKLFGQLSVRASPDDSPSMKLVSRCTLPARLAG